MEAVYAGPPLSRVLDVTADALTAVRAGRSLTEILNQTDPSLKAGVQALTFQVMRCLGSAEALRAVLAPRNPPPRVDALLVTVLALLWPEEDRPYPDHTLVDQAVRAARTRTPQAAAFINAVLRRFLRERDALAVALRQDPVAAWNHPTWWIARLRADWPAEWQVLLEQANRHPPMTLRVNTRRTTVAHYLQRLNQAGLAAQALEDPALGGQAVLLSRPCPVQRLPGFAEGEVSVQDAAAQRAAPLLLGGEPLPPGARVLDACAAPGGKTAHLLERADLQVLAVDSDARRLKKIEDNLQRLGLQARLQTADARYPARWWDGEPFDAILLDAPCTASGIVRRHPDVRWLRRPEDVAQLAGVQAELLEALWPLLKPQGRLLYATCSLFRMEGAQQIDAFAQRRGPSGARLDPAAPGHLLPLPDNRGPAPERQATALADGFFYALIHKP